jgi:single-strand DNA-binding protein
VSNGYLKVSALGNLTRDPELKHTPKNTPVTNFGLAVNTTYRDAEDKERKEVCYIEVETWGKQAENAAKYLAKGRLVNVFGDLKFEQWETDNEKRSRHKIRASEIHYMPGGRNAKSDAAERAVLYFIPKRPVGPSYGNTGSAAGGNRNCGEGFYGKRL